MNKVARKSAEQTPIDGSSVNEEEGASKCIPGFSVQRRSLLWLPVLTASMLFFSHPRELFSQKQNDVKKLKGIEPNNDAGSPSFGDLSWDDFIEHSVPEAQALYKDPSPRGQDVYLFSLAHWAARLRLETIPKAKVFRFGELNPPIHFGVGYKGVPFVVVEWQLEPRAFLPPHNHPNYSVCTLGIEGEAHIRNFQIAGEAPAFSSKNVFHVRETHSEVISAGRINSFSTTRDNIHTFQAGSAGARGIDFGTLYGKDMGFSFLDIDKDPIDVEKGIYQATWKKLS